ncbi:hypothetical protein ACWEP4_35350 [Streptomyces sp. NPDC004227]
MRLYFDLFYGLTVLLFAASGVAAVTRGWVFPMDRRRVRRVRLFGWGQLVMAFALCWQVVFGLAISGPYIREWGATSGIPLLLTGFIVMMLSHWVGGNRQGSGTP